jgi:deoxyribose-phosphate aldolase
MNPEQLARMIDHSLLKPQLTDRDIEAGCAIAARFNVFSVSVKPRHIQLARQCLHGTGVLVGTVVGFPHGDHTTATKVFETHDALDQGADEFDMVIAFGALRSGEDAYVQDDIAAVVEAARGHVVKVILENCYLTDEEKVRGCRLAEAAGAAFVKTSTGFAPGGATLADVRLMRASVGPRMQVKAAGGINTWQAALDFAAAGATRLAASQTEKIFQGAPTA